MVVAEAAMVAEEAPTEAEVTTEVRAQVLTEVEVRMETEVTMGAEITEVTTTETPGATVAATTDTPEEAGMGEARSAPGMVEAEADPRRGIPGEEEEDKSTSNKAPG